MLQGVFLEEFRGSWTASSETNYQWLRERMAEAEPGRDSPAFRQKLLQMRSREDWEKIFRSYEEGRFARLCAALRQQEPDDQVGYSILIYRLSDQEVDRALTGPAPWPRNRSRASDAPEKQSFPLRGLFDRRSWTSGHDFSPPSGSLHADFRSCSHPSNTNATTSVW
jgi:hypothetical protein